MLAGLVLPGNAHAAKFINGVTAGEVTSSSAIIWGQAKKSGKVEAQVSEKKNFKDIAKTKSLQAKSSDDNTVQTKVSKLDPAQVYFYRFCINKNCSDVGTFETAPKANKGATIHFAYSGDETGVSAPGQSSPYWGQMKAFKSMMKEGNDFNIDLGDTIYSDPEVPNFGPPALTVEEKWEMYRAKLAIKNQRLVRAGSGMYNHWDDHEFINDFSIPADGPDLYDDSVTAFRDYMPVTYSESKGIYRKFRWGKNLEIFFLDERSFRSGAADDGNVCDNGGSPDLAPTAPAATRSAFAPIVPQFNNPPSQACLDLINSPDRSLLGQSQYQRFLNDVKNSTAKWKVIMNEVPIQQFYANPYDRWEGYAYERVQLLTDLEAANINHLVFLTTDVHASFANVVRYRTLADDSAPSNAPAGPTDSPYADFTTGPVATTPFSQEIEETTGIPGSGPLVIGAFFKPPPPNGMGMACSQGNMNSYAQVTVSASKLKIEYKDENGNQLLDSDGTTPCGPYTLTN